MYKAALGEWNKGTGGGSGLSTEFERWGSSKFEKYNIQKDTYDHSNISSRPLILFDLYTKSREPFLTVIRLWDNEKDNILCSKYDPIAIGMGEVGLSEGNTADDNSVQTTGTTTKKRKAAVLDAGTGLQEMINNITQLCKQPPAGKSTPVTDNTKERKAHAKKSLDEMSLEELYDGLEQTKRQIEFLTKMGALSDKEKNDLVSDTKEIFSEIRKCFKKV